MCNTKRNLFSIQLYIFQCQLLVFSLFNAMYNTLRTGRNILCIKFSESILDNEDNYRFKIQIRLLRKVNWNIFGKRRIYHPIQPLSIISFIHDMDSKLYLLLYRWNDPNEISNEFLKANILVSKWKSKRRPFSTRSLQDKYSSCNHLYAVYKVLYICAMWMCQC